MQKTTNSRIVIRKYGNRRLYDTSASRYVNLDDIARAIRGGSEVEVVDARTGEDLTRVILTQIIVEAARDSETGLPLHFLRQLVMASDKATHEFLSWYMNTALDVYRKAQETVQSGFAEARHAVSSPLEFVRGLLGAQPPAARDAELEELRRRVQELEARLARRPAKRKR